MHYAGMKMLTVANKNRQGALTNQVALGARLIVHPLGRRGNLLWHFPGDQEPVFTLFFCCFRSLHNLLCCAA